jgi:hypothetical protein
MLRSRIKILNSYSHIVSQEVFLLEHRITIFCHTYRYQKENYNIIKKWKNFRPKK